MANGARQIEVTVELAGLPTLVVTGEPCPPEPEVGISWWVVDQLDWRGAYGALTPEQDLLAYEHTRELEDAVVEAFHERRSAERAAMAGGAL
jgi:hypothetical protein